MKTIKTSELTGSALDWAVAKCEGKEAARVKGLGGAVRLFKTVGYDPTPWQPSTDWAQGGPIVERECIELVSVGVNTWAATSQYIDGKRATQYGTNPLIAAMRCYVASKLGDTVEISEELL